MRILRLADQKIPTMDKLQYYVCQMDELLAKYVKVAEVESGHNLELDKTMENMRFTTNMNDQYTNKSDNEEDVKDDVEDIHPGDKLVNYFNNGINYNDDDDNDDEEDDDDNDRDSGNNDNAHGNATKGARQFVVSLLSGSNHCGQVLQYYNCFILQGNMLQLTLFVHKTQELKDRLEYDKEEDLMTHQSMTFWFKHRTMLIHDYSLVGYILSQNPQIMNNASERVVHSPIYSDAVTLNEHKECLADMTTKFFDEHQKFVNQTGILKSDTMWYAAGKREFFVACRWHYTWTLSRIKVFGKLACLVLSKILGIGTAKCNRKQVKKIKDRDCSNLGPNVTSKITNIYQQYQQVKLCNREMTKGHL
jgi:hypothetical protein